MTFTPTTSSEFVDPHRHCWAVRLLITSIINRQARGDDTHNLVTIVMHEHNCGVIEAVEWISGLHDRVAGKFLSTMKELPSFGDPSLDKDIAVYVDGLANWVRSNERWSFEVRHILVGWILALLTVLTCSDRSVLRKGRDEDVFN